MSAPDSHLIGNLVRFARLLRAAGVSVTAAQMTDLITALQYVDLTNRQDFKHSMRAVWVNRWEHLALFDRAFDLFWHIPDDATSIAHRMPSPSATESEQHTTNRPSNKLAQLPNIEPTVVDANTVIGDPTLSYNWREVLRHKDFASLSEAELRQLKYLLQTMRWQLEQRRTRRKTLASRGNLLDMRRTMRQNLRFGGEPLHLKWRQARLKPRPLVVLCDVSGSMERYTRILLEFIYGVSHGLRHVETFVFSTRLTRITRQIRQHHVNAALSQAVDRVHDWGGGTRIGAALKTFNVEWGRRVLSRGAVVLIISDGWDRGDIALLDQEIKRLRRSCQRLIWLNPLLGAADYQPLVRGIQTVLPHIDDFLPIHNLRALEQLGVLLERLCYPLL